MKYKRILLKLSGESLAGEYGTGIDASNLQHYVNEIKSVVEMGVQVAIVLGGGNIFRGVTGAGKGIDRVQGDYMGMIATVINSLALQSRLEGEGVACEVLSGLRMEPLCRPMTRKIATELLSSKKVIIISGGTGNPFFTTDSAGALRAVEIEADAILKGTRVDGVYSADPEKDPTATRYENISFDEVYKKNLRIMDMTAFTLCKENQIPVEIFDVTVPGNLKKVLSGEKVGTLVS